MVVLQTRNYKCNGDNNLCISGVFGWDFNLITSNLFVTCVRQLNTMFVLYLFFFFIKSRL